MILVCKRKKGRHTAEKIRQEYEEALAGYDNSDKVRNVITDNDANMKKALQFSLPGLPSKVEAKREDSNSEKSDSETDEHEKDALEIPDDNVPTLGHCYAHTIQLVVKDGLSETSQHLKGVFQKLFLRKSLLICGAPSQLSTYDRKLLKELCSIMKPFEEAT